MTGRERILAALRRQPVDRVPWAPLLVPYTIAGFPDDFPHHVADAQRAVGCDIWTQAVGDRFGISFPMGEVKTFSYFEKGDLISGYETPVGRIFERHRSGVGSSLNAPVKPLLETVEDLKVYLYVLENSMNFVVDFTNHAEWEAGRIRDDGIAADAGIGMTPFKTFIELLAGVENTVYFMVDEPELFDEVMTKMHEQRLDILRQVASQSAADVFVNSENTSWTTMSPANYDRYCKQQLDDYTNVLHEYGKIHCVHMCGKLKFLADGIAQNHFDAVIDIAPPQTGDTELWEACELFPNMAVKGGIGCETFIDPDPKVCYRRACEVLERVKHRPGVLLGSGDSMPNGTTIGNLVAIRRAVDDCGRL